MAFRIGRRTARPSPRRKDKEKFRVLEDRKERPKLLVTPRPKSSSVSSRKTRPLVRIY